MFHCKMKLLSTCIVLLIVHIPFYGMEPKQDHSLDEKESADSSCDSCGGGGGKGAMKPPPAAKPPSCSRAPYKEAMCDKPSDSSRMCDSPSNSSRNKATKLAYESAEVAKAANKAQAPAAQDASRHVKLLLADKAASAALAADLVMEGKQAIVYNLAREIQEAEKAVDQIKASLEASRANVCAAGLSVKMSDNNVAVMQALVDEMRGTVGELDALCGQASKDLEEKNQVLAKAKARGDCLAKQFESAKGEYEKVKIAACRAVSAAVEAKKKAKTASLCRPPVSVPAPAPAPAPVPGCGSGSGSGSGSGKCSWPKGKGKAAPTDVD